jgi:hypothetical protein
MRLAIRVPDEIPDIDEMAARTDASIEIPGWTAVRERLPGFVLLTALETTNRHDRLITDGRSLLSGT